jgi:hypothetical protein
LRQHQLGEGFGEDGHADGVDDQCPLLSQTPTSQYAVSGAGFTLAGRVREPDFVGAERDTRAMTDERDVVDRPPVTVLDRFLAAGISRESFDEHLAAGQIAVAGERITDPATPAPPPTTVAIMLPPA